jgi:hypothetical protein
MQSVPFDEDVIRKEVPFVRFEIVIDKGSAQRRGSGWETGQWQNCQNHVMHCGRCFPIIIDAGVQLPVDVSPPSAIDIRSIYSPPMGQLTAIDDPDRRGEQRDNCGGNRSDGRGDRIKKFCELYIRKEFDLMPTPLPDGIVATIQNATRSVRISILFVSVRWTGHFFAISISCLRCASSNGPANSMLHRMRSILDFGSSQFAQSSAWTRSCRSRTMTCSRVHFFRAAYKLTVIEVQLPSAINSSS